MQTDNLKFKLFAQKNLNITLFCKEIETQFIASIYMESRKVLKERMQIVCCLRYGKGEYPEEGGRADSGSHH